MTSMIAEIELKVAEVTIQQHLRELTDVAVAKHFHRTLKHLARLAEEKADECGAYAERKVFKVRI